MRSTATWGGTTRRGWRGSRRTCARRGRGRRCAGTGPGGGGARAAAAAAAREVWLLEKVEASVFARVLQGIEDRCLNCVRLVLQGEGWPARSWQQDGLLVEDMGGRQLRGGGDESRVNLPFFGHNLR